MTIPTSSHDILTDSAQSETVSTPAHSQSAEKAKRENAGLLGIWVPYQAFLAKKEAEQEEKDGEKREDGGEEEVAGDEEDGGKGRSQGN